MDKKTGKPSDLIGKKFGKLTVIKRNGTSKDTRALWLCKCDCGNEKTVDTTSLIRGFTQSCGCICKHGMTKTRIWNIWCAMKERCNNPNCSSYHNYGKRGICVCKEWEDFIPFYEWSLKNGYNDTLTIDRINNDNGYEPDNCRWITRLEQCNNTRRNRFIEYNGEVKTIAQLSRDYNINYQRLLQRLRTGLSIEDAINKPVQHKFKGCKA